MSSCSSDDDNNYSNADLVGTWYFGSSAPEAVETTNDSITNKIIDSVTETEADETDVMAFTIDGKFASYDADDEKRDPSSFSGTYSINGDQLTLTYNDGDKNIINITSTTKDALSFRRNVTELYQKEYDSVPNLVISKVIVNAIFKKVIAN